MHLVFDATGVVCGKAEPRRPFGGEQRARDGDVDERWTEKLQSCTTAITPRITKSLKCHCDAVASFAIGRKHRCTRVRD